MYTIIVTDLYTDEPSSKTTSYEIQKSRITIGRAPDNDVVILQTNISSSHAEIVKNEQGFFFNDLNSTNGSFINKIPVQRSVRIFSDDQIEIGGALLRVTGHPALERHNESWQGEANGKNNDPFRLGENDDKLNLSNIMAPLTDNQSQLFNSSLQGDDFSLSRIAAEPYDTSRPSVLLDDLLPSYGEDKFKGQMHSQKVSANSTFPETEEHIGENGPFQSSKDKLDLINKIKLLESKAIAETAGKEKSQQRHNHVNAAPGDKTPKSCGAVLQKPALHSKQDFYKAEQQKENLRNEIAAPFPETDSENSISLHNTIVLIKFVEPISGGPSHVTEFTSLPIYIGRDVNCEITLQDVLASHRHAIIELNNGRLVIRDLRSRNGVFLNGRRIEEKEFIGPSDIVSVGKTRFCANLLKQELQTKESTPSSRIQTMHSEPSPFVHSVSDAFTTNEKRIEQAIVPELKESYEKFINGNHFAISLQLYFAKNAIGKALEVVQIMPIDAAEVRLICKPLATAVRALYTFQLSEPNTSMLQKTVDSVIELTEQSLSLMKKERIDSTACGEAIKAHSLLFPLSSVGRSYFESVSSPMGLSLLSELGFLGVQRNQVCTTKESIMTETYDPDGATIAVAKFSSEFNNLQSVRTLTKCIADTLYLDEYESFKLISIVDEACTNAIEHGLGIKEQNSFFSVAFVRIEDSRLAVVVDDKGIPIDTEKAEKGDLDGLGIKLMREFCEEVHFLNLGKKGKRVLMITQLSGRPSDGLFFTSIKNNETEKANIDTQYSIETLNPNQAAEIPKCVYNAYKYDYYDELLYLSAELKSILEKGELLSAMAFSKDGTGLGHMSVSLEKLGAKTGLLNHMIIVPSLTSTNMASRLTTYLIGKCQERGMSGLTVNMTASHPYEQIVYTSLGARITGLMLGHFPVKHSDINKALEFPWKTRRQSAVTAFLKISDMKEQEVFLPQKYSKLLRTIYKRLEINRELKESTLLNEHALPAISNVLMNISSSLGTANIKILEIGDDISDIIEANLIEISNERIITVYMDLPLSSPSISHVIDRLEKFNFCFSCLIPEDLSGDILRLQLLKADVDFGNIHIEQDYGKYIFEEIKKERRKVL